MKPNNGIFLGELISFILFILLTSCKSRNDVADAFGNFESEEIIVSAQNTGELIMFRVEQGKQLKKGDLIGIIDSIPVILQRNQLFAQKKTLGAKRENIQAQANVQSEQLKNLERETSRTESLYRSQAATEQQYDDMKGKLSVAKFQLHSIETQYKSVLAEENVLDSQLNLIENQLNKCKIINPVKGIVLEKYVNEGELVTVGKSLYKIADLNEMDLKVYVSGNQLSDIILGNIADVYIDGKDGELIKYTGKVSWISSEVEFTPKIIQTREERVNMVYGVKIRVKNDGSIKIGMPGEVKFQSNQ